MGLGGDVFLQVLPNSCRGLGMGLTITTFWTLAFIIQMSLENLFLAITTYGKKPALLALSASFVKVERRKDKRTLMEATWFPGTFFVFACLTAATSLFVYFHVPEGAGLSLESLQQEQLKQRHLRRQRQQKAAAGRFSEHSRTSPSLAADPPVPDGCE